MSGLHVYLAQLRGNWLNRAVLGMLPHSWRGAGLRWLLPRLAADSWMTCMLMYYVRCGKSDGGRCEMCAVSPLTLPSHLVDVHQVTLQMDGMHAVRRFVDKPFEDRDAWLFVRLNQVTHMQADTFARAMDDKAVNQAGVVGNFLGTGRDWLCRRAKSVGIQTSEEVWDAPALFCSEMMCAFLHLHKYELDLVPSAVTPQMLVSALLQAHPVLASQLFVLGPVKEETVPSAISATYRELMMHIERQC